MLKVVIAVGIVFIAFVIAPFVYRLIQKGVIYLSNIGKDEKNK